MVSDGVSPHLGDIFELRGVLRNFVIVSIVVLNLIARFRYETGVVRVLCGDLKTQRECRGE